MTLLEIAILLLNLGVLVARDWRIKLRLALGAVLGFVAQWLLGEYRWQMVPATVFDVLALALLVLARPRGRPVRRGRGGLILRYASYASGAIAWIVSAVLPFVFPIFTLLPPTGSLAVGTTVWPLTDTSREEIYTPQSGDPRRLIAQIWQEDVAFVIDQLQRLNQEDGRFTGRLDLARLGIIGMSLGGANAGESCSRDPRLKAGINTDGLHTAMRTRPASVSRSRSCTARNHVLRSVPEGRGQLGRPNSPVRGHVSRGARRPDREELTSPCNL